MSDKTVVLTPHTNGRLYWPHLSSSSSVQHWQRPSTPVVVFFVGGGWEINNVDHGSYQRLARVLVDRGWIVLIPEFRRTGWGTSYLLTLLPLHFILVFVSYVCLMKPSRSRMFSAVVVAIVVSILLCVLFFHGAEWTPVSFDQQVNDCMDAVRWTQTNHFHQLLGFEPRNVFLMGYSSGANLAAIVNTKGIECVRGCICVNGLMDGRVADKWTWMVWFWVSVLGTKYKSQLPLETYMREIETCREQNRSFVASPLLVVTGSHESPVLQQSCFRFVHALSRLQVPVQFLNMPYRDHFTALDDILYNHPTTNAVLHASSSKQLLFVLNNFVYTHLI